MQEVDHAMATISARTIDTDVIAERSQIGHLETQNRRANPSSSFSARTPCGGLFDVSPANSPASFW